jgi:hypothetical protein
MTFKFWIQAVLIIWLLWSLYALYMSNIPLLNERVDGVLVTKSILIKSLLMQAISSIISLTLITLAGAFSEIPKLFK